MLNKTIVFISISNETFDSEKIIPNICTNMQKIVLSTFRFCLNKLGNVENKGEGGVSVRKE